MSGYDFFSTASTKESQFATRSHSPEPCGMILVTTLARMTLLASFSPSRLAGQEGQHPQTPSCIHHTPQYLCSIPFLQAPPYCLRFRTQPRGACTLSPGPVAARRPFPRKPPFPPTQPSWTRPSWSLRSSKRFPGLDRIRRRCKAPFPSAICGRRLRHIFWDRRCGHPAPTPSRHLL